jgi:hypothetical protein
MRRLFTTMAQGDYEVYFKEALERLITELSPFLEMLKRKRNAGHVPLSELRIQDINAQLIPGCPDRSRPEGKRRPIYSVSRQ